MDWRDIPRTVLLGPPGHEEPWRVRWRRVTDTEWTREPRCGETDYAKRIISLDERLKNDPTELHDTWLHKLMHASLHYWTNRPKWLRRRREEKLICALAPIMTRALNQTRRAR